MKLSASVPVVAVCLALAAPAQTQPAKPDKADAYYNFAMGHLYAELSAAYGNRGEYATKAIEHYKQALRADPSASFLFEELADLYIQTGRLKEAVSEAEALIKQDPNNLDARRVLARIYTRSIGDAQQGKINEGMLNRALEQYQKITEKDPKDTESWLALGRLHKAANNSVEAEKAYTKALALDANSEEALTGLAIVYADVGDTQRSIEKLKELARRNPSPRTLAALANSYEQVRDYKSAAEVLRRALEAQPDNLRFKRGLAQNLLFSEQYDEALKLYNEIAQAEPKDVQAHLRLAAIHRQKRDFGQARAALAKAKEIDGNSLEVRYDEVNLLEAEGKTAEALALLKGILEETARPNYSAAEKTNRAMLLERLGVLYRAGNQPEEAVAAFRQIAELDADNAARVAVQVIETWRMARDFKKAAAEAEAAAKQYPNERLIRMVHASVLADMGKTDEAAAQVRSLLNQDRDREIHLTLAQIYEKGKRFPEMQKALDEAEKLSTSEQEKEGIYFMRGAMFERMKRYDAAEAEFRKVLAIDPDNASALNYLGYMFADRGVRLEEAQKLIARALELDPDNGAYLDSLGWVYYHQNRLDEAEDLLRRALARVGKDPTIRDHLGDVYAKQGKTKEAITQWEFALKEWEGGPASEADPAGAAKVSRKLESARVRLAKETNSLRK